MAQLDLRWRLQEVVARYTLEPTLRDIYVEGRNDRLLLQWFLQEKGRKDVQVSEIERVEVPLDLCEEVGLPSGSNRGKLIALAQTLSIRFDSPRIKVVCIADADYDRHLRRCRRNYVLHYTDYASMEVYLVQQLLLEKFATLVLGGLPITALQLMEGIQGVLQRLFLIRLANEALGWNMTPIKLKKYTSIHEGNILLEEDRFITSYLGANHRLDRRDLFESRMRELQSHLHADPRHNIRGHDFTDLFVLIIRKLKGHKTGFTDPRALESALRGCLELAFVDAEPLFVRLAAL